MRAKVLNILLIILMSGTPEVLLAANSVLVAGPEVRPLEIEAYAEAFGKRTLAEELDEQRPGAVWSRKLQNTLERAQKVWLSDSPIKAQKHFIELANLSLQADWKESQRRVLHYAHLRIAQAASTEMQRNEWLRKAASRFPDVQPDSSLFPPPLLADYDKTLAAVRSESVEVDFGSYAQDSRILLVNGRRFHVKSDTRVRLTKEEHRFTLLSDSLRPLSLVAQSDVFDQAASRREALVSGSCETSTLDRSQLPASLKPEIFLSPNCTRQIEQQPDRALAQRSPSSSVHTLTTDQTSLAGSQEPNLPSEAPLPTPPSLNNRRTWVLAGLTAVAITTLYISLGADKTNSNPPEQLPKQPVTVYREGF